MIHCNPRASANLLQVGKPLTFACHGMSQFRCPAGLPRVAVAIDVSSQKEVSKMANKAERKKHEWNMFWDSKGPEIQQVWKKPQSTVLKKKVNLQEVSEHSNGEIANFTWRCSDPFRMKTIQPDDFESLSKLQTLALSDMWCNVVEEYLYYAVQNTYNSLRWTITPFVSLCRYVMLRHYVARMFL